MFFYRQVTRNTGVGVGGCLGLILALALSWVVIGVALALIPALAFVVLGLLAMMLAWVGLWVIPVSIYRGGVAAGWGVPAAAGAAWGWAVLVVALTAWIAL